MSFVVNNHEGEKDENSGYEIHQHLQHQDDDIQGSQCLVFVVVTKKSDFVQSSKDLFEPDFDDREGDGDEGEEYREGSPSHQFCDVVHFSINIRKTVSNLEPELEI